jgi:hypothetical protein
LTKTQSDQQTTIAPLAASIVTPIESDVFDTIPVAAQPSPGLACAAAHACVELITAGRYGEIGILFSSDAIFVAPDSNIYHGQAEITRFYSNFLARVKPSIIPLSFIGEGDECIMELAYQRPGRQISFERHRPFHGRWFWKDPADGGLSASGGYPRAVVGSQTERIDVLADDH